MAISGPGIVSLGSRKAGLTIFKTATAAFDPKSITGLQGWFKADAGVLDASGVAITVDGTAVKTWTDQSTNARNATQATVANQPIYKTAIQNGKPVLRFDGAALPNGDFLKTAAFTLNQPVHGFYVIKLITRAGANRYFFDGNTNGVSAIYEDGSANYGLFAGSTLGGPTNDLTTFHVVTFKINGASSSLQKDSGTASTGAGGSGNPGAITIGAAGGAAGANGINADIGEVLIYNAILSGANEAAVQGYLKTKWGTP